eukprot:s707_g4.t1
MPSLNRHKAKEDLDGDGLCRLVRRLAAWLHRPVARTAVSAAQDAKSSGRKNGAGLQTSKLQSRIRRVLIMALQHIDLTDEYTWKCLESALTYIQGILDEVDLTVFPSTSATRQWFQLSSLISHSDDMKGQPPDTETSSARHCKHLPFADSAEVSAGAYYPNKTIKGLPTVFEGDHAVQLRCSSCPASISSRWFFRHPVTDQISVLVPGRGHYGCRKKLGKFCPWIPVSDVPPKHARFEHLDFCPHKRELRICKLCCGSRICEHQKRRDKCGLCKHIPRRVVAEKSSGAASFKDGLGVYIKHRGAGVINLMLNLVVASRCIHRRPPNSQVWTLREDGQIFSEENGCLAPAEVDEEELPSNEATWSPCRFSGDGAGSAVEEQRFHDIEGSDFFRLVLATGHCLMAILGEDPQPPRLAKSVNQTYRPTGFLRERRRGSRKKSFSRTWRKDKEQQWQWAKPSLRLGLKPASKLSTCLDTDNGQKPLMYVCYSMEGKDSPYGVENTNQAFWLTPEGHITQWGPVDTSFSNLCLDGTQRRLSLVSCQDAEQRQQPRAVPRRSTGGLARSPPSFSIMGDKKGGDEINYQQENDYMKRKIEVLRYRIMIKDEQILGCRKSEDGLRKRIAELDQSFEDEAVRCRENTAEMSRQYREMQESFNDTIDVLQKKVSEAKAEIESVTKEIEQVKIEKEEVLRQKDLEIASLSSKMETMAFEFADMLKETLDKMSQRIEVTHNSWDRDTTKPPLINRLKEFGLNDEPND